MTCLFHVASAQSIFTCVDSKGRKLTSDRPIQECLDREQRELNSSGSTRRSVGPSLSPQEVAAQEERARAAARENNRQLEEKRRVRALLSRYPDRASHDRVRAESLVQFSELIRIAQAQLELLKKQRAQIDEEMEFYRKNPKSVPATLRRQLDDNTTAAAAQKRFILDQEEEKARLNARFDEELARLKPMWLAAASTAN